MRRLLLMAGLFCGSCVALGGERDIPEPYKAKALNPVKLSENRELKPLIIAARGKASVPIVCDNTVYYRQIAGLLKEYLDRTSGAEFVITDKAPPEGRAIFVGPNGLPSVKAVFDRAQAMPAESLVVESIPEGIVLAGKDAECENRLVPKKGLAINDMKQSRGTFFATVDFLERLVGVRFYFPGIGVHIPDCSKVDIAIPAVSYSDTPSFDFRSLGYYGGMFDVLLRLGDVKLKEAWHTDSHWHKVYGKSHPEYFALRDDGTRAVGDRGAFSAYRCYSSEAGFKAHIEAIEKYYKTGEGLELFLAENREFAPNRKYIHWGAADAFRGCFCGKCLALTDAKLGDGGRYSTLMWRYTIELAKECARRWPGKVVATLLYGNWRVVPDFVYKENPGNLLVSPVRTGSMGTSAAFLKEPKAWDDAVENLDNMRRISCEKPYIWLHYPHAPRISNSQKIPYMAPHYYQKFMRGNKGKISGMLFNGDQNFSVAMDGLMLYMMYKISWNPDFDVDACVDEHCSVMFGPAAPEIKDYYKTLIDRWENVKWKDVPDPRTGSLDVLLPKERYWVDTYPRTIRDNLEGMLRQALAKTQKGTIYFDRVKFMIDGTAPFFEQGRFFDLGKVYKYDCMPWTPDKEKGLRADQWRPVCVGPLSLVRNDNGALDDTVQSQILISYDDKNLYISGKIEQQDAFITKGAGKKVERDNDIWAKDSLEIFLCSEQPGLAEAGLDQKNQYHQFIIDPDGSIFDGVKTVDGDFNSGANFNFGCKTIACTNPDRFYFDLVIPFSELKCVPPKPGSKWYVNFYWNHPRGGKLNGYTWAGTGGYHDTSRFGLLEFMGK